MKKVGLCLTGGGAKGAYQIGALEALNELGLYDQFVSFSGTSIGAANVSVLASKSIDAVKKVWMNLPDNALVSEKPVMSLIWEEGLKTIEKGIYSMDTFEKVMMSQIDYQELKRKEVYVTVSEVGQADRSLLEIFTSSYEHYIKKNGKAVYVPLHNLDQATIMNAVKASCSIPIVFPPVISDNKKYYDGGLFDNTPVIPLIEAGCTEIYIIDIAWIKQPQNLQKKYPDIKFHVIKPTKSLGSILDFSIEHAKVIYEQGYNDALAIFKDN